jgi:hypothetical protein
LQTSANEELEGKQFLKLVIFAHQYEGPHVQGFLPRTGAPGIINFLMIKAPNAPTAISISISINMIVSLPNKKNL